MVKNKVVGKYICATLDWSASEMSKAINEQQNIAGKKLCLSGTEFEIEGTEHQVVFFSEEPLTDEEISREVEKIEEEYSE